MSDLKGKIARLETQQQTASAELAARHLRKFLQELHDESGAQRIHLIAHSMGSRALAYARASQPTKRQNLGQSLLFCESVTRHFTLDQKVSKVRLISAVGVFRPTALNDLGEV